MITSTLSEGTTLPAGAAEDVVVGSLEGVAGRLADAGVPVPPLRGKLLRPRFALAMVPRARWQDVGDAFWWGALAVQMAHEASLIHDDVVDEASERRGAPTVAARHGVARAIILGDHYLTGAYRAAAATRSFPFVERFVEAVERTVAGEVQQGAAAGHPMEAEAYDAMINAKSGALFGAVAALGSDVVGIGDPSTREGIGRDFGNFYQRIDDLLDYCVEAATGKSPLRDFRHGKWSWVLDLAPVDRFEEDEQRVLRAVFEPGAASPSPARRALEVLRHQELRILHTAVDAGADRNATARLLRSCFRAVERGVEQQEATCPM